MVERIDKKLGFFYLKWGGKIMKLSFVFDKKEL